MLSCYMAIDCLLERDVAPVPAWLARSRVRCIIGGRNGCYRDPTQWPAGRGPTWIHCYSCLSSKRHLSSPHQPPPAWASGHLASTRSCYCQELSWKHARVPLSAQCDSSTEPRNDIGSVTVRHSTRTRNPQGAHVTSGTSGTRGRLLSRVPLLSCLAPRPSQTFR